MILVTGAAGFIGSNIVADLEEVGCGPVAVCDWFGATEKWRNLAKREIADFVSPEVVLDWLESRINIQAVIHMGAISATTEHDVDLLVERNIKATVDLWDWCSAAKVPFIYASSAATYGATETDFFDYETSSALAALRPLNPYGWSKNATDQILMRRIADGQAPPQWVGLKFFNVYGPNEYHKGSMMSVVAKFFDAVRSGETVKLFKSDRAQTYDGEQMRDFAYVKDCTRVITWLLENPHVSGLFNLGTGKARTFNDLIHAIGSALNTEVYIDYVDMPEELKQKYQYFTQAEMQKLALKGFDLSFHSLEAGVRSYVLNYLNCEDRYR